ncbi:MAG TPA: hypothetical protein VF337_10885 [Candidatus Limnocylindrales bacterium]
MNDNDLEKRLQNYYTTFTPDSSARAIAGVDRTLADRRAQRVGPFAGWGGRPGLRGVGALAGLAVAVVLVAALFPLWGRTGIGPATNGPVGPASALVDEAGVARDGAVWAIRGQGLSISRDHGLTWTEHRLPAALEGIGRTAVLDADHAWMLRSSQASADQSATGPVNYRLVPMNYLVYRTSDGGATWESAAVPVQADEGVWNLAFVSDSVGFLFGSSNSVGSGGVVSSTSMTIMRTEDGGATWATTARTDQLVHVQSQAGANVLSLDSVVPVDADTLWAACGASGLTLATSPCPLLRVSHDAGATWTGVSLPGLGDSSSVSLTVLESLDPDSGGIRFISPTEGYVAVQETIASGSRTHYFRTLDGGLNWSQVALVEGQEVWAAPIFVDSQHWFQAGLGSVASGLIAVGTFGTVDYKTAGMKVTSDGGKTWRHVAAALGFFYQAWMSDALHGAALVGDGAGSHLFILSDGGETWHEANLGPAQYPNPSGSWVTAPPLESGTPGASPTAARSVSPTAEPSVTLPEPLVTLPEGSPSASPAISAGASAGN